MADYAPAVKKLLKEGGCWLDRQGKGDQEIWFSLGRVAGFPVDQKIQVAPHCERHPEAGRLVESVLTRVQGRQA